MVGDLEKPDEFVKLKDTWCKHSGPSGCAIHATKPKPCAAFECAWLRGILPRDLDIPMKSKIVVSLEKNDGGKPGWCMYESVAGAARTKIGERIRHHLKTVVVKDDGGSGPFPIYLIPPGPGGPSHVCFPDEPGLAWHPIQRTP